MSFHVASHAEGFTAASVGALERLLAGVRVAVDAQGTGTGERFVACLANVAILGLRERRCGRGRDVMVVLPWVGTRRWHCDAHWHGREGLKRVRLEYNEQGLRDTTNLWQWSLVIEPRDLWLGGRSWLHGRIV